MARLLVHVEGETEEQFVNELLRDHLCKNGYSTVSARILGNARLRLNRGGIRSWNAVRDEIVKHLRSDHGCLETMMVDYYGLPESGDGAWPGRSEAKGKTAPEKAQFVEDALLFDMGKSLGDKYVARRFLPFVVVHEFEGLLFSDCRAFATGICCDDLAGKFAAIRGQFATPEDINDSPNTAPSKRLKQLIPKYQKPLLGILAALEVGLETMRRECPHFAGWLSKLEEWPAKIG